MSRFWWAVGAAAVVGVIAVSSSTDTVTELVLARGLPTHARRFAPFIVASARKHGLDPWKLAAVLSRESDFGNFLTPKGPAGRGDAGHGHGLGQIDDRTWGTWLATNPWWDPAVNIDKSAAILAAGLKTFKGDYSKALAAYNAGPANVNKAVAKGAHPDTVTTGKNYSSDVIARAARFEQAGKRIA